MNTNDPKQKLGATINDATSSIKQYLKDTARETANLITDKLRTERQKQTQTQQQIRQDQQAAYFNNIMLQLQYELWYILRHTTPPSGLIKIIYVSDLLPSGWKIIPDGILFAFRWNKSNAEPFHRAYLDIIKERLNAAIFTLRQRLLNEFGALPYPENELLWQQFPLIFIGFFIQQIIDTPTDIVLIVKMPKFW